MGMGRKKDRQATLWVATAELPRTAGHVFYERVNRILDQAKFDRFVEDACEQFYAEVMGRPSVAPGKYFGSSAEFVGKTVFHRRLRRPRCSPSLKASLASSAAAPALTLGCAPRCRLVWAMGNGASGGGSGHRV